MTDAAANSSDLELRQRISSAQRLVVKIGSSCLTRADGRLDLNRIDQVAAVLATDSRVINRFVAAVDAAAMAVNASTRFTDGGQLGLGAELGISTQKLHARGPMGLEQLTTWKWIIEGDGHVCA